MNVKHGTKTEVNQEIDFPAVWSTMMIVNSVTMLWVVLINKFETQKDRAILEI